MATPGRIPVVKMTHQQLMERVERFKQQQTKGEAFSPFNTTNQRTFAVTGGRDIIEKGSGQQSLDKEWWNCEKRLEKLILRWAGSTDHLEQVLNVCHKMEELTHSILQDRQHKEDCTARMWRSCHYKIIEKLRKFYKQSKTPVVKTGIEADLKSFLTSSKEFYLKVVELCQQSFSYMEATAATRREMTHSSKNHKQQIKINIQSLHHCYLALGDLGRYYEELESKPDWSKPRSYYLKSQELVPKDGKPYNQLAVIAINAHRRLDAVYYYYRSLWVRNTFLSAHDNLVGLFDETSRKAQEDESIKNATANPTNKRKVNNRSEVWLIPGHKPVTEYDEIYHLESPELQRKLFNVFLLLHSKLFTKVGIAQFDITLKSFMMILNIYLEKGVISLRSDAVKFLKMVAINISTIHHVIDNTVDAHSQSVSLIMSLSFSLQFVTSILKHCHTTLKSQVSSDSLTGVVADTLSVIATLLPSVRVWLNWVSTHGSLWQPLISDNPVFVLTFHDFLTEFCHVINTSQVVLPLRIQAPDHVKPLCSKFWEDKELAGFSCLANLASSTHEETLSIVDFNLLTDEQIHFQCLSRLSLLQFETISLTDTSLSTLLSYNDQTNSLNVCLQLLPAQDPPDITKPDSEEEEDELDIQNLSRDATPKADEITESLEILELKKERDRLAEELLKKQQQEEITQTLLNEACNSSVHVEVTIKPHYLVPDTNCFIKYLNSLKDLLSSGHFIIAVPLIVITELEGLSKGDNECQSSVNEFALNSLEFIKSMMSVRSPHLRLITSQGNLMSSLFLTSEEITDKSSNDDVILMSCVKLHEKIDSVTSTTEFHSVVLLTDDRNLRVKSLACHLPVKSVKQFLKLL